MQEVAWIMWITDLCAMFQSYINQSNNLHCLSINWFLCDGDFGSALNALIMKIPRNEMC